MQHQYWESHLCHEREEILDETRSRIHHAELNRQKPWNPPLTKCVGSLRSLYSADGISPWCRTSDPWFWLTPGLCDTPACALHLPWCCSVVALGRKREWMHHIGLNDAPRICFAYYCFPEHLCKMCCTVITVPVEPQRSRVVWFLCSCRRGWLETWRAGDSIDGQNLDLCHFRWFCRNWGCIDANASATYRGTDACVQFFNLTLPFLFLMERLML